MQSTGTRRHRLGLAPLSVLFITAFQSLFFAWVRLGLDEDRRQWASVDALKRVGGGVQFDYPREQTFGSDDLVKAPFKPQFKPRWPGDSWLYATPWCSSRWWISHLTDVRQPLGTAVNVTFAADGPMTDAQWKYFCGAFPRVRRLKVFCPVKDEQLRFLKGMSHLEEIEFSNFEDHAVFITGEGFSYLRPLPKLNALILEQVRLSEAGKRTLGKMENLDCLVIDREGDDDTVAHLTGLKRLVGLSLRESKVTDAAIPDLKKLQNLLHLGLRGTRVSVAGCEELFSALPRLLDLEMPDGQWLRRKETPKPR